MTTETIRAKAERALRLHNDAAPHIKAREQCQLLGERAREWMREHPEDDGESLRAVAMEVAEALNSEAGVLQIVGGHGSAASLMELRSRLLAALGVE